MPTEAAPGSLWLDRPLRTLDPTAELGHRTIRHTVEMQLESAFVAQDAKLLDGLLFSQGAFPEWLDVPELPIAVPIHVVVVVSMEREEIGLEYPLEATVRQVPSNKELGRAVIKSARRGSGNVPTGIPLYHFIVFQIAVQLEDVGPHVVLVSSGDRVLRTVPFGVRVSRISSATGEPAGGE